MAKRTKKVMAPEPTNGSAHAENQKPEKPKRRRFGLPDDVPQGSKLIIVESPSKAKTINKYLGKEYVVEASVGHIKNLPKSKLGVDVENGFALSYETITGKEEVIEKLRQHAAKAAAVYLATDPDREGEAIAWHLAQEIEQKNPNVYRVLFHEITERGIAEAMQNPQRINQRLVDSQQARRAMDRLVGYKVTPFLWKTFFYGVLSAGRVQSVAVRLICEREEAINSFIPEEYWSIVGEGAILRETLQGCRRGAEDRQPDDGRRIRAGHSETIVPHRGCSTQIRQAQSTATVYHQYLATRSCTSITLQCQTHDDARSEIV